MDLINVGYGSVVNADKVLAVLNPDSAPIKRAVQEARDAGKLIDASYGRKTRAVLVLESGYLLLSGIQSETIAARAAANIAEEAGK